MRRAAWVGTVLIAVALGACGGSGEPDAEGAGGDSRKAGEPGISRGREIAFTRLAGTREDRFPDIILINANGSGKLRLTHGPEADTFPAWSPDGKRIAFSRQAGGSRATRIWVIDADGEKRLTRGPDIQDSGPAWSPDGERIAFARFTRTPGRGGSSQGIYVMNADGSGVTQLTDSREDGIPDWSPDGERIVFSRGVDIWVMKPDGSGETSLTDGPEFQGIEATSPSFSPDGERIAFVARRERTDTPVVWVMRADGSDPAPLKNRPRTVSRNFSAPAWSPSGRRIAFAGERIVDAALGRLDRPGIYVMNSDGTDKHRLRGGRLNDSDPAWSPASTTPHATSKERPRGVVEDCSTRSEADFPGAFTDRSNLVVGPLALMGAGGTPEYSESFGGNKFPLLVRNGHRVTVELSRQTRRGAGLAYGPLPHGEVRLRDAHRVVRFIACRHGKPSGSSADGRPVTFWSGGVLARSPRCVPLRVWVDDNGSARRAVIRLGVRRCA